LLRENYRTRQYEDALQKLEETAAAKEQVHHALELTAAALRESESRLERELAAMQQLQSAGALLVSGSNGNVQALYQKIVEAAAVILQSDCASMQMLFPERGAVGELRLLASQGFDPEAIKFWEWVRADSASTCGAALKSQTRVIVPDVEQCDFMAGTDDRSTYLHAGIR